MADVQCIWDAKAELGEGVIWHPGENAVYWVDIFNSTLYRFTETGHKDQWHLPGRPSAVMPCEQGGLLATFEYGLAHIELGTMTVTPLRQLEQDLQHNRFNDGCSDSRGQFWFGSMDEQQLYRTGSFYRLDKEGVVHPVTEFGKMCITNGPAFSTDGAWIYFTDTLEGKILRAQLNSAGEPVNPSQFIDFSQHEGHPDGMCCDTDGGLWVCHYAGSKITRFDRNGVTERVIEMPVPNITKCAFGGSGLNTLYVTTAWAGLDDSERADSPLSGALFAVDVPFTGSPTAPVAKP